LNGKFQVPEPMLSISPSNGTVNLPNGISISADLTQAELLDSGSFGTATARDNGTLPWIFYSFSAGEIDQHPLLAQICFYDQLLVSVDLCANLYAPGELSWSNYSLDVESAIKSFHDELLTNMLGACSVKDGYRSQFVPESQRNLFETRTWNFPWGKVHSTHDDRGGSTMIFVQYGDRRDDCAAKYRSKES
jgi:hypothetical protein